MAITVSGLIKRYRGVTAVDDISFDVDDGQVFAFLGTNGAGKSTTIGCLTTTLAFDAGTVEVAGHDVVSDGEEVREAVGVVFQDSLLDPTLTVRENLALRASFAHLDRSHTSRRITELSALIELDEFLGRRYGQLSGGQRRRVDIARALLHEPRILFLDEPTAGLDPASRSVVWKTIKELRRQSGLTVFLTTHYMEETEEADRVCIIDRGRIIADGTPAELRAAHSRSVLTVTSDDPAGLFRLAAKYGVEPERNDDVILVPVPDAATARLILAEHGDLVRDFEFRHGRMDDVFLALTGRSGEESATGTEAAA
ncbi:multidrug/hemolysin transport system ATP-binding protein [Microbacterium sp. cf046]|uniref:ABC transporter ATP-binding protein n=1 Tax=Microbacterium sp. cf046 TaxID=1761803 RepID=UPI0008E0063E|nr:ABC transporter ATP-binding protein [Microbacterium sp. cf046]SFR93197.1 multidrug/hemolysin transport system ATP-binding protein [Microbacterium sp. cf046]